MQTEQPRSSFDPGLTQKYTGSVNRVINRNGQFNVRRVGSNWRDFHPYLFMVNMSWFGFFALIGAGYLVGNTLFALLYVAVGTGEIRNASASTPWLTFLNVFFFSSHTLTTVGYGNMYPDGTAANWISAFEALTGLMAFAIATGLLFGRFSRPSARIGFSDQMVVAPYHGARSLQFRVVNRRSNSLIDVQAQVLLMTVENDSGEMRRRFTPLTLERPSILFFPLTWTVVHPIDESSPLHLLTADDLKRLQGEFLILIKAFDDSFGQMVHSRYSYRYNEILWGAKFAQAFEVDPEGSLHIEVNRVGWTEPSPLTE
jgi:inward rectifier potassium channel